MSTRSITVCSRRAPIFSTVELTATATSASASMALSVISSVTPSVCHQRDILLDQRGLRLGQDAAHVVAGQRFQFDPDRQPALQFRQQIQRFCDVERAGGDEQDMVGLDRAVLGRHRGALDQRQQIALDAFARHVAAAAAVAHANFIDLVEEHDAVVLDRVDRFQHQLVAVQ